MDRCCQCVGSLQGKNVFHLTGTVLALKSPFLSLCEIRSLDSLDVVFVWTAVLFLFQPHIGIGMSTDALVFVILCPVGAYFPTGLKPIKLMANSKYIRAYPKGTGDSKLGWSAIGQVLRHFKRRGFEFGGPPAQPNLL